MDEDSLQISERLLVILHNLCATNAGRARKSDELARVLRVDRNEVDSLLNQYESEGYAGSLTDDEGNKRYYLTGIGIIRVCSVFT